MSRTRIQPTDALDNLVERDLLVREQRGQPLEPRLLFSECDGSGRPLVRWFLCYAEVDEPAAVAFRDAFSIALQSVKEYAFEDWHRGQVLVGERWRSQMRASLESAHIGVALLSSGFLAREASVEETLREFIKSGGNGVSGKRLLPVQLGAISSFADLKGIQHLKIYGSGHGNSFLEQVKSDGGGEWISELVNQLIRLLNKYGEKVTDRVATTGMNGGEGASSVFSPETHCESPGASAMLHGSRDLNCTEHLVADAKGEPVVWQSQRLHANVEGVSEGSEVALDYLMHWVRDPEAPPFFALLGEYGMGKTITCQRLLHACEVARKDDPGVPETFYFDLRNLAVRDRRCVPGLEDVLDECISRGWEPGVVHPTGRQLILRAKAKPCLFLFDGLDEALVHLDEVNGRAFTRELMRIRPRVRLPSPEVYENTRGTRILISCRTHYFRTLADEEQHFTGNEREGRQASDYRALLLLPFSEPQVRAYIDQALPNVDVDAIIDLVRSVHNLNDLAGRPFTLKLVADFIPELDALRSGGQVIYGATLYRKLVERWLARDDGKHHLKPVHKKLLMEHVASWMWQRGERVMPIDELEARFAEWVEAEPGIARRYRKVHHDKLEEDLRTATFLVREDLGLDREAELDGYWGRFARRARKLLGLNTTQNIPSTGFRFAHSSLHEYFLARHLFAALDRDYPEAWAMEPVSRDTMDFLGQLLSETPRPELLERLGSWGRRYESLRTEQLLRYVTNALRGGWPLPSLSGLDLHGVDLRGFRLEGGRGQPLDLSQANFRSAQLSETVFHDICLDGADFRGAQLQCAEWVRVSARGALFDGAIGDGALFSQCEWSDSRWRAASLHRAQVLWSMDGVSAFQESSRLPMFAPQSSGLSSGAVVANWWVSGSHTADVNACAWSSDGGQVVSASSDCTLRLWDASSGQCLDNWAGHSSLVNACAWSPNGNQVVSASNDHTLRLWDASSGQCLAIWKGHSDCVTACAWSPDGTQVVSTSVDKTLRLWEVQSGQGRCLSRNDHECCTMACAWSPDGTQIASASKDGTLRLWDVTSGQCLATWRGHRSWVRACAWSPDGTQVVSASDDKTLRLWDVSSGRSLAIWRGHQSWVRACAWSPDGTQVISASDDKTLRRWDAKSGECVATWEGHSSWVMACAWSPDGAQVVSASTDKTLRLWSVSSGAQVAIWTKYVGSAYECANTCSWSPDGARVVAANNAKTLRLWDANSGECLAVWKGHSGPVTACEWSSSGTQVVSASNDGTLRLWDVRSGKCVAIWKGHADAVTGCTWSPDDTWVVSASNDNMLRVWDVSSGKCVAIWKGHTDAVTGCTWSPDGTRVVSASRDRTLWCWEAQSGKGRRMWRNGHERCVMACAWSPDGAWVVSASKDYTLRLWDMDSTRCLATWKGHGDWVMCCAWSPDSTMVVSASWDNTFRLWDMSSGQCLAVWDGDGGPALACAWSPDGTQIVSASADGSLRFWQVATGECLRVHQTVAEDHAVWEPTTGQLVEASDGAWRWLRCVQRDGHCVRDVLPAETFGALQLPVRLGVL